MTPTAKSPYAGYRFPGEVISHAVWLYFRFPLSLRMVEEMLAARGIDVSHETVRQWAGSVRARASQYSLCSRTYGDIPSCGLQDGQHGRSPPEVEQSAAVGGNVLMVAGAEAEEVAQFIVGATEPGR